MNAREREWAKELAGRLGTAFTWSGTPQGHEYWYIVSSNLYALSQPPVCKACGQEVKE